MMKSLLRIVFDPGGDNETVILDWLQHGEVQDLAWSQQIQTDQLIGADWANITPRGNIERTWTVTARESYTTAAEMLYEPMDHDADLPINVAAELHVRVLDLSADPEGTEAARTLKHYKATVATIAGVTPKADPETLLVDYTYQLRLGALTIVV